MVTLSGHVLQLEALLEPFRGRVAAIFSKFLGKRTTVLVYPGTNCNQTGKEIFEYDVHFEVEKQLALGFSKKRFLRFLIVLVVKITLPEQPGLWSNVFRVTDVKGKWGKCQATLMGVRITNYALGRDAKMNTKIASMFQDILEEIANTIEADMRPISGVKREFRK